MSLLQTEKLPSPIAVDGVVVTDVVARSLGVRLSETANGYQRLWWKQAHQALKAAVEKRRLAKEPRRYGGNSAEWFAGGSAGWPPRLALPP